MKKHCQIVISSVWGMRSVEGSGGGQKSFEQEKRQKVQVWWRDAAVRKMSGAWQSEKRF